MAAINSTKIDHRTLEEEKREEILDLIFNFNHFENRKQEAATGAGQTSTKMVKGKSVKHAIKFAMKQQGAAELAKNRKSDFESPYRHYKITTTLRPIGYDLQASSAMLNKNSKGASKFDYFHIVSYLSLFLESRLKFSGHRSPQ